MHIKCSICGEAVSNEVPSGTIIRAWIECVACIAKEKRTVNEKESQALFNINSNLGEEK